MVTQKNAQHPLIIIIWIQITPYNFHSKPYSCTKVYHIGLSNQSFPENRLHYSMTMDIVKSNYLRDSNDREETFTNKVSVVSKLSCDHYSELPWLVVIQKYIYGMSISSCNNIDDKMLTGNSALYSSTTHLS